MYQDSGYGENWRPTDNRARRTDPYARSCVILVCLFIIGFFIIITIILSLIPIYLSKNSSTKHSYRQVSKISVKDFRLDFDSLTNFETIFSNTYNLLILQASLTSRIQNDTLLVGSIINITISSIVNQTFNLNVISNTSCQVNRCLILFQQHSIDQLTNSKRIKLLFRYEQMISNGTKEYLSTPYYLPQTISTNASIVTIDPNSIALSLQTLLKIDQTINIH